MTFAEGKRYFDSAGRSWLVRQIVWIDWYPVLLVKRDDWPQDSRIAPVDDEDHATVLFDDETARICATDLAPAPDDITEYLFSVKTKRRCPFCGFKKTYISRTRLDNLRDSKTYLPYYETVIHCEKCGATYKAEDTDKEKSLDMALQGWEHRDGDAQ